MVKRKECLAYEYGEWRFEWYVNEGGNSPAPNIIKKSSTRTKRTTLIALFDFLAIC